jgi:AcrR family transcriptional regulator
MTRSPASRPSARQDLLATALELFSRKGIGAVGIDEVTRTAGRTRDSLYRVFGSKTGLVVATLELYGAELPWLEFLRHAPEDRRRPTDPAAQLEWARKKLLVTMERVADWSSQQNSRGCYLLTAAAELRGHSGRQAMPDVDREAALKVIRDFHQEARRLLAGLAEAAGVDDAAALAADLHLEIVGILGVGAVDPLPSRAAARRTARRAGERTLAFHGIRG